MASETIASLSCSGQNRSLSGAAIRSAELTPLKGERQFKPFFNLNGAPALWTNSDRGPRKIPPFGGTFLRLSERNNQGMKIMPENSLSALLLTLLARLLVWILIHVLSSPILVRHFDRSFSMAGVNPRPLHSFHDSH